MRNQITANQPRQNRTGLGPHPELLQEMVESTSEFGPTSAGGLDGIAQLRVRYAQEASPTGTMPPSEKVPAERLHLLDRLGARLQFEKTGTRLYEAVLAKHDAYGAFDGGPTRDDLMVIRNQEHHHAVVAKELIERLGGDPTALTPTANLQAIAGRGILDVVADPRTSLIDCLEAIVVAELADHESWHMLVPLARDLGDRHLLTEIEAAENVEDEHLKKLRAWLAAADKIQRPRPS